MYIGDFFYEFPTSIPQLTITSYYYIAFILICFFLSRIFNSILRPYILLIANIFFLYTFGIYHLIAITIIAIYCYIYAFLINRGKNKIVLFIGIIPIVLLLLFFKYKGLFNIADNLFMPLGFSFYSFKAISYLVDIYKDKCQLEKNPIFFLDYLLFFPCITAGPINRANEFLNELRNHRELEYRNEKNGGIQIMFGVFEKLVICDFISHVCNLILNNNELTGLNTILGIALYSFVIYLDFDSYSNIAIGSARLLGFNLPKNFHSPYLSRNLMEFWDRWHISLSSFLKDYIYIPLGGSKKGKIRKYLNILIVFLISGIWHGSTINFIIWGLLHGLIRIIQEIIISPFKNTNKYIKFIFSIIGIITNFIIVTILWLIFKYQNMQEVFDILKLATLKGNLSYVDIGLTFNEAIWLIICIVITIFTDILRNFFDMLEVLAKQFILFRWVLYACMIIIFLIFGVYGDAFNMSDFIYQWF